MLKITPGQLPAWFDRTKKAHLRAARAGLRKAASDCHSAVVVRTSELKPYPPVDIGIYTAAWTDEALPADQGARLFNAAPHAGIVEWGVRPGRIPSPYKAGGKKVPMRALVEWAYRKFYGRGKTAMGRQFKSRRGQVQQAAREQGAFMTAVAVQAKIHAKGIPGKFVLTSPAFIAQMVEITRAAILEKLAAVRPEGA